MRIVGQRIVEDMIGPRPVPGALLRAGAHLATVFAFNNRVLIRRGVYRLSHDAANRQMDDATVELMRQTAGARARG